MEPVDASMHEVDVLAACAATVQESADVARDQCTATPTREGHVREMNLYSTLLGVSVQDERKVAVAVRRILCVVERRGHNAAPRRWRPIARSAGGPEPGSLF